MQAEGQPAVDWIDRIGDQCITWRCTNPLADTVGPAHAGDGTPRGREIEPRLGERREAVSSDGKPFARGINSIQLLNDGHRWWIVTVYWDSERPDNPLPHHQPAAQPNPGATPTTTFGAGIQAITPVATRRPTPTRIRIPTRLPDSGTNKNHDMCTVIPSEHAARPSVPMCVTVQTPQAE